MNQSGKENVDSLESLILRHAKLFETTLSQYELHAYVKPLRSFDVDWVRLAFIEWKRKSNRWPHQQRIRAIIQAFLKPKEAEMTGEEMAASASAATFAVVASSRGIYPGDKEWEPFLAQWDAASMEQRAAWRAKAREKNFENRERRLGR